MALSIGVVAGNRIKVGQSILKVKRVIAPNEVSLSLDGGDEFIVTDAEVIEVMPEVKVFCGVGSDYESRVPNCSRLAFEAPRSIIIRKEPSTEGRG